MTLSDSSDLFRTRLRRPFVDMSSNHHIIRLPQMIPVDIPQDDSKPIEKKVTPLPWKTMVILCSVILSEPISFTIRIDILLINYSFTFYILYGERLWVS